MTPRSDVERHEIRDELEAILHWEEPRLTDDQRTRLECVRDSLTGDSFHDRLQRWVGKWTHGDWRLRREEGETSPEQEGAALADEVIQSPELLLPELDWLASHDAQHVYWFGRRLGELDHECSQWDEIEARVARGLGLTLAAAYLQGQVDGGRREWRDSVLDAWAQHAPPRAEALLEAVYRGHPNDPDADRLAVLIEQGSLPPAKLMILAWGAQAKHFSPRAFRDLMTVALAVGGDDAVDMVIQLTEQWLDFHPECVDDLEEVAWSSLESIVKPSAIDKYHWGELAQRYFAKDPQRIARAVLSLYDKRAPYLYREDQMIQSLVDATRLHPAPVWDQVAARLQDLSTEGGYSLLFCLQGWYADVVGSDVLLAWAQENLPEGPALVARMASVGGVPLNPLARELLIRFPNDRDVGSALYANYGSGVWSGPMSEHFHGQLVTAREWLKDPEPAVRNWSQRLVDSLEQQIRAARLVEEERGF